MPQMKPKLTRKKPSFWDDSFHRKGVAMLTGQGVEFGKVQRLRKEDQEGNQGMAVSVSAAVLASDAGV